MFCFVKYGNCKKLSKITKLSKRMIRTVDSLELFDVGYRNHDLVIAVDAHSILSAHANIHRTDFGEIAVFKWHGSNHETSWFKSQAEAFLDALAWVNSHA